MRWYENILNNDYFFWSIISCSVDYLITLIESPSPSVDSTFQSRHWHFFQMTFYSFQLRMVEDFNTFNSTQHSGHWSFWADGHLNWSCFGVSRFNLKITVVNFRSFCVIYFFWRHVIHPRSFLWISLIAVFLFQSLLVFGLLYLSISLNLNPWLLLIIILPTDTQFMILTIFHNGSLRRWQIISTFII